MLIRPATTNDIPALMALDRSLATAAHWSREQYEQALGCFEPRRVVLMALQDGAIQGLLAALQILREWEIENLVVAAPGQQRGLGTQLIRKFLELARDQEATSVFLEVRESNVAARRLYEKAGFEVIGRRKSYYREPEEDALIYRLKLI